METHRINNNNDTSINNEADVRNDGLPDDNDNYGVIYDRSDDNNPLHYHQNIRHAHQSCYRKGLIIRLENTQPSVTKLTRNFDFGMTFRMENPKPILLMVLVILMIVIIRVPNVPNQANYNMPTNWESKSDILLRNLKAEDTTTTTAPVIRMDMISAKDVSSNLNVVAAATAAEVNKDYRFWEDGKDYDAPISNIESESVFIHDYGNNDDTVVLIDSVYETVNQY